MSRKSVPQRKKLARQNHTRPHQHHHRPPNPPTPLESSSERDGTSKVITIATMKKVEVKRASGAAVGEMKTEIKSIHEDMKSMRKEMRLLQAENVSLRADNLSLQHDVRALIHKVNSLEERDDASLAKEGKDPPGSFEEDSIARTDSDKENQSADEDEILQTSSGESSTLISPQKNLAYRNRIRSRMSYSPMKKEEEEILTVSTPEKSFLGLTGRRSQIYKEINRIKTSPAVKDKSRQQTMNF
jgi:regulator of replication initiation timing